MARRKNTDILLLLDGIELFWPLGVFLTLVSALCSAAATRYVAGLELSTSSFFAQLWFLKWMPWLFPAVLTIFTICLGIKTYHEWRKL